MKGNFKATEALVLLDSMKADLSNKENAAKWSAFVGAQIDDIGRQERLIPRRAVAVGLMLHVVKGSLKHGQFRPWLDQMLTGLTCWSPKTAHVYASYYMRLAIAFVDQAKPKHAELQAMSDTATLANLADPKGTAAKLMARIDAFIGERSLNEVLIDEGIKQTGGSSGGGAKAAAALPADDDTLAEDTGQLFLNFDQLLLSPDNLKRFPKREILRLREEVRSRTRRFEQIVEKLLNQETS